MHNAALNGELDQVEYVTDPIFGFRVPKTCPGIPDGIMNLAASWPSREAYNERYRSLASRIINNFKKFEQEVSTEVITSSPNILPVTEVS